MEAPNKKIVLVRCPQPILFADDGAVYSPNRTRTPEPTLAQLHGILRDFAEQHNTKLEVVQLDLRDPNNGKLERIHYGNIDVPYLGKTLSKIYEGVNIESFKSVLEDADFIGFTNNFTMSRNVVCEHIRKARSMFPEKELWIGGRDVYTDRINALYAAAARNKNIVLFDGHVFSSLPAYLLWKIKDVGEPFGVTIYGKDGETKTIQKRSLLEGVNANGEARIPLPIYSNPASLGYFTGSGEGQPDPPFGRFVHMMISIGCPHSCAYCTTGAREGGYLVRKDMETLRQELDLYKKLGVTTLAIMDDNLLALGPADVIRIMELVNSYGFGIEYGNGLQLSLLNKDWKSLKDPILSNCDSLYAPLEDLTRDRFYDKLDPTKSNLDLMRRIAAEAPTSMRYLTMGAIVGVPGHTKKALETAFLENVKNFLEAFNRSHLRVGMTTFNFIPLAGTMFGDIALKSGRMFADAIYTHPEVCNFGVVSYAPEGMTHRDVFDAYEKALELNPAGKELGVSYARLQRYGENALPENERWKIPPAWRIPGLHLRAQMPRAKRDAIKQISCG